MLTVKVQWIFFHIQEHWTIFSAHLTLKYISTRPALISALLHIPTISVYNLQLKQPNHMLLLPVCWMTHSDATQRYSVTWVFHKTLFSCFIKTKFCFQMFISNITIIHIYMQQMLEIFFYGQNLLINTILFFHLCIIVTNTILLLSFRLEVDVTWKRKGEIC